MMGQLHARSLFLSAAAMVALAFAASPASSQQAQAPAAPQSAAQAQQGGQQGPQRATLEPGYVGYSFLRVPDVNGDWRGAQYRGWVRADAHYWQTSSQDRYGPNLFRREIVFPLPGAPRSGEGTLVLSIHKDSPALPALMERCRSGATMNELGYAVSAERSNRSGLRVPLPEGVPENFEFTLSNAQFVSCPVAEGAPEQALVLRFSDIRWTNYDPGDRAALPVSLQPTELMPLPRNLTGETRAWVLTWFALANDVADNQCPLMNEKPVEDDYYRLVPTEEAAREREQLVSEGGVGYENGLMALRGPGRLNAVLLPGIVPDPGQHEPQTTVARGLNLDGSRNGHRNYASDDGRATGIDNQLYTVMGCNAGWSGHTGFMFQYNMEGMRNGQLSVLIQVDGVDNMQNDREVYVTMLYSTDDMAKNGAGNAILHDYTFRPSTDPQYTHFFQRVRGRINNGVITTEPVDMFRINAGRLTSPRVPGAGLAEGRMRFEVAADGSMRGVLAGYSDWRQTPSMQGVTIAEFSQGFQMPALYNSLRRNADGLRDPVTGENNGISTVYDLEGVPAYLASSTPNVASAPNAAGGGSQP